MRLILSSGENKPLDLTIIGTINTQSQNKTKLENDRNSKALNYATLIRSNGGRDTQLEAKSVYWGNNSKVQTK